MTPRRFVVAGILALTISSFAHAEVVHTVRRGQTLFSIARVYGVTVQALARLNNLPDPSRLKAGQRLVIPVEKPPSGATATGKEAPPGKARTGKDAAPGKTRAGKDAAPGKARTANDAAPGKTRAGKDAAPAVRAPQPPPEAALDAQLHWPLDGRILSRFAAPRRGDRRHKGIDIGAPQGTPIRAAADGVVAMASEHHGAYGRLVCVDHGDGVVSWYGHNSSNLVTEGQKVKAGEVIALVGRTGNASSDHLHFEVRVKDRAVDPAGVLPPPGTAPPEPPVVTASLSRAEPGTAQNDRENDREEAEAPRVLRRADRALYPREPGKGPPPE